MELFALVVALLINFVDSEIVHITRLGSVQGSTTQSAWTNRTIYQFLSIQYGKSPSGNRRFAPSVQSDPWKGIYDATKQGIGCPQITNLNSLIKQSDDVDMEDCLTLNIFTTYIPDKNRTSIKLHPVLVHIHGGRFVEGGAKDYQPNYILEHDVVLVVPQYRLGALGCLALHTEAIAGNMGLMDQLLALQWVYRNIKFFGGNKNAITLSGHSSGAFSVAAHLISPIVKPYLFQKVIIKSGSPYSNWGVNKQPVEYARDLYKYLTNTSDIVDVETMQETFINASLVDLISANLQKFNADSPFSLYGAVIQEAGKVKYLTELPIELLKNGKQRALPMLAGVTKHEGSILIPPVYDGVSRANLQSNDSFIRNDIIRHALEAMGIHDNSDTVLNMVNNDCNKGLFSQERLLNFTDISPTLIDIYGTFTFKSQMLKQAKINVKKMPQTYLYSFDYRGQYTNFNRGGNKVYPFDGGIHHSDELMYLFYDSSRPLNANDTRIAQYMVELFTNFIIKSEPYTAGNNVQWPAFIDGQNGPYLHIDNIPSIGYDFVESEFWAAVKETSNNNKT